MTLLVLRELCDTPEEFEIASLVMSGGDSGLFFLKYTLSVFP